ncbi:hypothetical protein ABR738_01350 [Streptomyces sp. Edi4]|uniref:hypothetical protein n=1 Tax=Streptomyces sp. Edi4 TaxID=3162527 RepID=UPI003305B2C4
MPPTAPGPASSSPPPTSITPENCDPANLRAYCNGCHLDFDGPHHRVTQALTRAAAHAAAGQLAVDVGAAEQPVMLPIRPQHLPRPVGCSTQLALDFPTDAT